MNEWVNEWMSELMSEWVNEWISEWMNEWMNEWMSECVSEWVSEWMNEQINKWVNEWANEWTILSRRRTVNDILLWFVEILQLQRRSVYLSKVLGAEEVPSNRVDASDSRPASEREFPSGLFLTHFHRWVRSVDRARDSDPHCRDIWSWFGNEGRGSGRLSWWSGTTRTSASISTCHTWRTRSVCLLIYLSPIEIHQSVTLFQATLIMKQRSVRKTDRRNHGR